MLEELADKVIGQMDRLAVTSFDTALSEMIDFHRFLIDAYTTNDTHGSVVSLAQIGDWGALHRDWISQYRRVFERAAEHIGRENTFIEKLSYAPLRLLPLDGRRAAPEVVISLLDTANILVLRLEAWLTRHRTYETDAIEGKPAVWRVPGSDKQAYEEVVMRFIGAWESTLQVTDQIYAWRRRGIEPEEQWHRYTASWPLLQRHLRNTAYLLAVAVWNEDETGAGYYCEALLRWFDSLQHELEADYGLADVLLTPDLLEKDWIAVQEALAAMAGDRMWDQPVPAGVFGEVLQRTMADAIFLVIGVTIAWFIEKRQDTDIGAKIAFRLLSGEIKDDTHRQRRDTGFQALILNLVRVYVAGERYSEGGYGHWLDGLVELLDSMTERLVVPGRVYSPSTRRERQDLVMPWLASLLASMPAEGDENVVQAITRLTGREESFSKGDRTLRGLLQDLRQAKAGLAPEHHDYLARGVKALLANAQVEERIERLSLILDQVTTAIDAQRAERLRDRPVDAVKLEAVRKQVEREITENNGGIEIFQNFAIVRESGDLPKRQTKFSQVEKGFLTESEMAQLPGNMWEVVAKFVQDSAIDSVWLDFARCPRRPVEVADEAAFLAALTREANQMLEAGIQPTLLVPGWRDPEWIRDWFGWAGKRPEGLTVHRKTEIQAAQYIGTVNEVDVYRARLEPNVALLFRADLLDAVRYHVDAQGRVLGIEYVEDQNEEGVGELVFQYSLETEWKTDKVMEFKYPETGECQMKCVSS